MWTALRSLRRFKIYWGAHAELITKIIINWKVSSGKLRGNHKCMWKKSYICSRFIALSADILMWDRDKYNYLLSICSHILWWGIHFLLFHKFSSIFSYFHYFSNLRRFYYQNINSENSLKNLINCLNRIKIPNYSNQTKVFW